MQIGRLRVDPHLTAAWLDGELLELSGGLYRLLLKLAEEPERAVPYAELVAAYWQIPKTRAPGIKTRAVATAACRLRQQLGEEFVIAVPGIGYRLVQPTYEEVAA